MAKDLKEMLEKDGLIVYDGSGEEQAILTYKELLRGVMPLLRKAVEEIFVGESTPRIDDFLDELDKLLEEK